MQVQRFLKFQAYNAFFFLVMFNTPTLKVTHPNIILHQAHICYNVQWDPKHPNQQLVTSNQCHVIKLSVNYLPEGNWIELTTKFSKGVLLTKRFPWKVLSSLSIIWYMLIQILDFDLLKKLDRVGTHPTTFRASQGGMFWTRTMICSCHIMFLMPLEDNEIMLKIIIMT